MFGTTLANTGPDQGPAPAPPSAKVAAAFREWLGLKFITKHTESTAEHEVKQNDTTNCFVSYSSKQFLEQDLRLGLELSASHEQAQAQHVHAVPHCPSCIVSGSSAMLTRASHCVLAPTLIVTLTHDVAVHRFGRHIASWLYNTTRTKIRDCIKTRQSKSFKRCSLALACSWLSLSRI